MDQLIQSRINKSLIIHGLQNLVFQKRQRKTVEPIFNPFIVKSKSSKKCNSNKKEKSNNKNQKQIGQKNQLIKPVKARTIPAKQTIIKQPPKVKEPIKKQPLSIPKKNNPKNIQQKPVETPLIKIKGRPKKMIQTPQKDKKQIQIKQSPKPIIEEKQSINDVKKLRGRPKKPNEPIELIQAIEQQIEQLPNIQPSPIKKLKSEQEKQIISSFEKDGRRNSRRVKEMPFQSYNQNDQEIDFDISLEDKIKKKKKISKNFKGKGKNKPYSLNRIFRKQAKRNFPAFTLHMDLNKVSLSSVVKEFGTFDLIHFSLPISFLNKFSGMVSLIEKGFIFVWVEQKETQIGYHLLNRWGFDIIDQIIWIKANEDQNKIEAENIDICNLVIEQQKKINQQNIFVNCKSTCLVGYKCPLGNKAEYRTKVSNNIIFSRQLAGVKKPSEIYEIADLMMPGAKKMEFGGQSQKGWLNLEHHQKTLYRCHLCFKQEELYLVQDKLKPIKCRKCIVNELTISIQSQNTQEIKDLFINTNKIQIIEVLSYSEPRDLNCAICNKSYQSLEMEGLFLTVTNQQLCIDCFRKTISTKQVKVVISKTSIYLENQMTCSDCGILTICDLYFECIKCKNHHLCKKCFWKIQQNESDIQEKKLIKKDFVHQWKLKFIKTLPLMKFTCFGCKNELRIPFWCCQSCQNWFWCGICDRGNSDIHPHYQLYLHKQYLMI